MEKKKLGVQGEAIAEKYLTAKGYKTVAKNFRAFHGEIDLVVEKQNSLLFVEVKTRTNSLYEYRPIGWKQKLTLHRTVKAFLCQRHSRGDVALQFDLILVSRGKVVDHLENIYLGRDH